MTLRNIFCCQAQYMTASRPQTGFSLVELMVAITIGLIIVAAASEIFLRSHATYQVDEGMARVQENARFAMDYLHKDIRMAGYLGCNSRLFADNKVNNIVKPASQVTLFNTGGLRGYRYQCTSSCSGNLSEWEPALPSEFFTNGEVKTQSDVIIINRGSDLDTSLWGNLAPDNGNIQLNNPSQIRNEIAVNDILLISDCSGADVFRATNVGQGAQTTIAHSSSGNTDSKLSKSYGPDGRLMKLVTRAYYVKDSATDNEPGLYRKELGTGGALTAGQELVGGVEAIKILYGVDTAGTGSIAQFVPPNSVGDWTKVIGVRLGFIARTPGTVDTQQDTKTYDLLGDTTSGLDNFGPVNDNRRRRVFNETIRIRNH
jgi:type IV pilus assembly protein PilW